MKLKIFSIIGLLLFAFLIYKAGIDNILNAFASINISLLIFAFLLNFIVIFLKSEKWRILVESQGFKYPKLKAFLTWIIGLAYGIVTPSRSGELIKIFYLEKQLKMPKSKGLLSTITDRVMDLFSLIIVAFIGSMGIITSIGYQLPIFILSFLASSIGGFLFFSWVINNKKTFKKILSPINRFSESFYKKIINSYENLLSAYNIYIKNPKQLFYSLLLSIIAWFGVYIQGYIITEAFSLNLSIWQVLSVFPISTLVSILPISIAGLGTREATLTLLLPTLVLADIIPMSMILSIVTIWIPTLIGFLITNNSYLEKKD